MSVYIANLLLLLGRAMHAAIYNESRLATARGCFKTLQSNTMKKLIQRYNRDLDMQNFILKNKTVLTKILLKRL